MKKVLSILVVLCMILSTASMVNAADYSLAINNNVAVMVGTTKAIAFNNVLDAGVASVEENGDVLAPAGFVTLGFNGSYEYDGVTGLVTIKMGTDRVAQLIVGYKYVVVNGKVYESPVAPRLENGQVLVPVKTLGETILGKHVYYDANNKLAVFTQRKCLSSRDREALDTIANAITSGIMPAIVIQAPVVEEVGGAMGGINAETGKLTIANVTADQEPQPENGAWNMLDGNQGSRWAAQGPASAVFDLGAVKPVTNIRVAVWNPAERSTNYSLEVSDNGGTYTKIFDGASSGSTWDSHDVQKSIRYIRMNTNGTSVGDWASILEVEAWNGEKIATPTVPGNPGVAGSVVAAPSGTKVNLTANMLRASQELQPENAVANVLDGAKETAWASERDAELVIDLGSAQNVSTVGVAMKLYEDERVIPYEIAISADGVTYSEIWAGESDTFSNATKYVSVGSGARYVKIISHGNTTSGWTSMAEVEVYSTGAATGVVTTPTVNTGSVSTETATSAQGTKVALTSSMLRASQEPQQENAVVNVLDGAKETAWASERDAELIIDLGSEKTLATVGVAMKLYEDDRTIPFEVEVSVNGASYTQIWAGSSVAFSNDTIYIPTTENARYVKIISHGNTLSGWTSMAEVEVYTK